MKNEETRGDEFGLDAERIEEELRGGYRTLVFSQTVEAAFERDLRTGRTRHFALCGVIGMLSSVGILINVWLLIPDMMMVALVLHLGFYLPMLYVVSMGSSSWRHSIRETGVALSFFVAIAIASAEAVASHSTHRIEFLYATLWVMFFSGCVTRLRLRYVIGGLLAGLIANGLAAATMMGTDPASRVSEWALCAMAMATAVAGAYLFERETRTSYLLAKRTDLLKEQIERSARTDPLTGLWNRRHLDAAMQAAWSVGPEDWMSVILIDVDHFKAYNDSCGHLEGDVCLQRIGGCLTAVMNDVGGGAVRFGGEEFLVFLPNIGTEAAAIIANRIHQAIRAAAIPHPGKGPGRIVTASFGVASAIADEVKPRMLTKMADKALYRAKNAGRDRITIMEGPDDPTADQGDVEASAA